MGINGNSPRNSKAFAAAICEWDIPTVKNLKKALFMQCNPASKEAIDDYFDATLRAAGWNPPPLPMVEEQPAVQKNTGNGNAAPSVSVKKGGEARIKSKHLRPLPEDIEEIKTETEGNFGRLLARLCEAVPASEGGSACMRLGSLAKRWNEESENKVSRNYFNMMALGDSCPQFLTPQTKELFVNTLEKALGMPPDDFSRVREYLAQCINELMLRGEARRQEAKANFERDRILLPLPDMDTLKQETAGNFGALMFRLRQATPAAVGSGVYASQSLLAQHWNAIANMPRVHKTFFYGIENSDACPQFLKPSTKRTFMEAMRQVLHMKEKDFAVVKEYMGECIDTLLSERQRKIDERCLVEAGADAYNSDFKKLTPEQNGDRRAFFQENAAQRKLILTRGGGIQHLEAAGLLVDPSPKAFQCDEAAPEISIQLEGVDVKGRLKNGGDKAIQ